MSTPELSRDMDLVRSVLVWAEHGGVRSARPTEETVSLCYHVKIMVEAGLIEGTGEYHREPGTGRLQPMLAHVKCLTWKGQEFLTAVRSDTIWSKVKSEAAKHGVPLLFDVAKSAALALGAQHGLAVH